MEHIGDCIKRNMEELGKNKKVLHFVPEAPPFHGVNYICHKCSYAYFIFPEQDRFVRNESEFTEENAKQSGFVLCDGSKRIKKPQQIVLNENKKKFWN